MHVMFIHPNFPAEFGHVALHLKTNLQWPCTFVTSIDTKHLNLPFDHINYRVRPGPQPTGFYNPDSVLDHMAHMGAIYEGLQGLKGLRPDLVVGHMSYGTMLYLRNLYDCPFLGYYEFLPPPFWTSGLVPRKEYAPPESVRISSSTYHTFTYLHLHAVDACYTPTIWQRNTAPAELRHKIRVIFDGVDADLYQPRRVPRPTHFHGLTIGPDTRVVTYVARGLESVRGFDIFMKMAKRIAAEVSDVLFLIAGDERTHYGHEQHYIGRQTFKDYVLSQDNYDLSKFHFLGTIPITDLAVLFNLSDLHIYLTVPFILSWSLVMAMSSGCTILASATAPVQEAIDSGVHGLLEDFYDVDTLASQAVRILRDPAAHRPLGAAARARVLERYEKNHCIDQLVEFFKSHQK